MKPNTLVASSFAVLSLLAPLSGCYFTRSPSRPIQALAFRHPYFEGSEQGRASCLVVMLPGFLDGPDTYSSNHFPLDLIRSGAPCDSVAVDLHYRYYGDPDVGQIVYDDILSPAVGRGYREIWLVGISMGGLGALMTARLHPELIDGIILLAPFVGDENVLHQIEAAGGLRSWDAPSPMPPLGADTYTLHLWSWIQNYDRDPDIMPPLYLGWGESDRLGASDRLLATAVPPEQVVNLPGGHNWATWRPIFQELLRRAPIGRERQ